VDSLEASGTIRSLPPNAATFATRDGRAVRHRRHLAIKLWLGNGQPRCARPRLAGRCWATPDLFTQKPKAGRAS
jgi:hypothetical protein